MAITTTTPHPFSLRQLQYAAAVAETLSFRRAAERCHVSQPSLSTQIAELEGALGVRLFERDRRRVLVTSAGRALLDAARNVLLAADDLVAVARRAGDPLAGTLRVGVIPTVSPYLLPSATPALRAAFPALNVQWLEDKTEVLVARLQAGALDAALLALEAELGDVEHAVVAKDPFLLAAPKGHPLARRPGLATPAELREADVLLLDEGHCLREQALAVCTRGRARELEFRATSLATLVSMVAGGAGVTLLPQLAAPFEARRGELVLRAFAEPAPHRTLALVWRARSPLAVPLKRVAETLREAVEASRPRRAAR
jgi:LysR family transcriptional regulator, hydrogen peroxide-inducible genes activator